ncbi:MAG: transglutaminase-like domain-containing protein [Terracidiphilus sp.]
MPRRPAGPGSPLLPNTLQKEAAVTGVYHLQVSDIPAAPDEEWMPPAQGLLYHVTFYYKNAHDNVDYWINEAKRRSKEVDHFAEASNPIKQAVAGLISPGDSDLEKAKNLYQAVQALDNTDFSRKKSYSELKQLKLKAAKHAEDTWTQKSGSSQDITLLYLAMLRAAGLTAFDMKVADRSERVFDPGYLNFHQLEDDIIVLRIGGHDLVLDPGEKMCPFLTMHWRHSKATGISLSSSGNFIGLTPEQAYTDNKTVRVGDITLDDHGAITGNLRFIITGQKALRWRQLALRNDADEVKKQFDHSLESLVPDGIDAHIDHFLGLDDPDVNLIAIVNVHGTLGAATSKRLLLPGFFFETRGGHPFVNQEKRLEPVDMQYAEQVTDQIVYHLPTGMTVEGAPLDTRIPWERHAVFVTKAVTAPGQVTIVRQLVRAFTLAKPEEYQDLRAFYQKVAAADQQPLVLTRTPVARGN